MRTRLLIATALSFVIAGGPGVRNVVGYNPMETDGGGVSDGFTGRIIDPTTGAGVFNPNLDPAVVGVDPLTGALAPTGTDMSFGAAVRRQMQTNVLNGDFSVLPPLGAGTNIDSDPTSATYNPLPGWTWTPPSDGSQVAQVVVDANYASGYTFDVIPASTSAGGGALSQLVAVPMSQGQQYRVLLSVYPAALLNDLSLRYTFYKADASTAIGSSVSVALNAVTPLVETKVDAGLVPPTAGYVKLELVKGTTVDRGRVGEVRAAFLPAEATIGLKSQTSFGAATTTTEKSIVNAPVPPGTLVPGSVYRITITGVVTSSAANVVTFRIRVGTGTTSGNIAASINPTATTTASADPFSITGLLTVRSSGGSGTVFGALSMVGGAAQPFAVATRQGSGDPASTSTSTITVDTTVSNYVSFTAVTAAATTSITFTQAFIECVMAS